MEVSSDADFKWAMAPVSRTQGYVIEYPATDPNDENSDSDGYKDGYEIANGSDPNDPASFPTYTLTLADGGTATGGSFTATGTRGHDTNVSLTATAQPGYKFGSWTGDASGTTTPLLLLMDNNKTVGAIFVPDTSDADGDGLTNFEELITHRTDPTKPDTDNDGDNDKFEIDNGTSPTDATKFTTYTITLAGGGAVMDGTVPSGNFAATPAGPHRNGANVTLSAVAKPGYKFSSWAGDASGTTTSLTLTMDGNKSVGATFIPNKGDTDGDGVSDYDEVFVLFTDPNFNPLASAPPSTPSVAIDYKKAKGTYQGMVLSGTNGLTYHLSLSVTAKGAFTGNIQGAFGRLAIKGSLSSTGTGDLTVNNLGELSMSMRSVGSTYVIGGKLESTTAGDYQFELRRAKTAQAAELLTFTAGLLSESTIHTGAAVATGTVAKNAKVTFQIYNADGTRATYAGSALDSGTGLDRGIISLFARNKQGSLLMGNMILVPNGTTAKNKLFGNLRFSNNGGFDQDREVAGATFIAPTVGTLPLSSFAFETNNMVMRWNDGAFDGLHKVATWLPTSVAVPLTENESASVTYDRKTGLMKAVYTLTDSSLGLNKTPSTAYAVTVDGFDDMIGMYMDSTSSGLFSVAPNSENLPPVGTYNKPKSSSTNGVTLNSAGKDVPQSGAGLTYTVSVVATGDWKVVIPSSVNWLSVSIANKNGTTSPALSGNGDATVTIIAATNQTQKVREAIITIGGVSHKVRQARY
jgi:phenolic acid decarboxylase